MQDITIIPAAFDGATVPAVNARDLHAFLGVKRDFNAWMKTQIKRARLVDGRDYLTYHEVVQVPHQGGMRSQTVTEYTVTVDAAKHIGMMSGTDKSHGAGIVFEEVNEAYTTQTCSSCGVIPASSPKGRTGLRMRRWTCCDCGAEHHRDVNAAMNIAARGHARLAGGIPFL